MVHSHAPFPLPFAKGHFLSPFAPRFRPGRFLPPTPVHGLGPRGPPPAQVQLRHRLRLWTQAAAAAWRGGGGGRGRQLKVGRWTLAQPREYCEVHRVPCAVWGGGAQGYRRRRCPAPPTFDPPILGSPWKWLGNVCDIFLLLRPRTRGGNVPPPCPRGG